MVKKIPATSTPEDVYIGEPIRLIMKPKKKQKKLWITEADFMLANRRTARAEDLAEHGGRPVSFRTALIHPAELEIHARNQSQRSRG